MSPRIIMLLLATILWATAAGADEACWLRHVGIPGSVITDMTGDTRGGLWVAGRVAQDGYGAQAWLARVSPEGRIRWQKRLPPSGYQLYPRLATSGRDIWIMAEILRPSVAARDGGTLGSSELWLARIGPDGRLRASSRLAPYRRQAVQAALPRAGGGLILAGMAEVGEELRSQGWLAALDQRGAVVWQRLLPEVAWLTDLYIEGQDAILVVGQATGDAIPWLARFDGQGRLLRSWQPALPDASINALLPVGGSIWLAGERNDADKGALLARFEPESGLVEEYRLPGLSTLRLLQGGNRELLVGGDGLPDAASDSVESAPGWLAIPIEPTQLNRSRVPLGAIERLPRLGHAELRAWAILPQDRAKSAPLLVGGGADPYHGAWFGCLRARHPAPSGPNPLPPGPEPK